MNWVIVVVLALALSVPVGSVVVTFGALALEFALGLLVEAAEDIESDPVKKQTATIVLLALLGGMLLCLCVVCVAVVILMASRSSAGIFG